MGKLRLVPLLALTVTLGCHNGNAPAIVDAGPDLPPPVMLEAACTDTIASIYADPGALPAEKGAIIRCAPDQTFTASDLQAKLAADDFTARPVTSGAHTYRILYRTERGDTANTAGYSSALVMLPDLPRAPKLPVVVASHGSRGQAAADAPSLFAPLDSGVNIDFERQVYSLAGYGYAVIAPDLAGYANYGAANNPPSGYAFAADVAKSTLDGARALRKLIPSHLEDQVVLVGHSQGGHTALSALAMSASYGAGGTIAAVVVYAPLWLNEASWGAIFIAPGLYPTMGSEAVNAVTIWYHYTHSEILDGPGHGIDVFAAAKQAQVKAWVDSAGWDDNNWASLHALGADASEIFDPTFQQAVGSPAANGADCPADANQALCQKWLARYAADRPHITGAAAQVPITVLWGEKDTTIPYDRITCAIDRLKQDGVPLTVCVDPTGDHSGVIDHKADYAADVIASKTLGTPAPTPCALDETAIKDPKGMPAMCNMLPPNN